jgi:iron-sulfur cluster assembly protein
MAMANPITLTDAAAERIRAIMSNRGDTPVVGLRVGIKTKGCSGLAYSVEYAEKKEPTDLVVEDKGVTVLLDFKAQMFLFGTEMDWKEDRFTQGFVFNNPNEKGRCGCGESFHV